MLRLLPWLLLVVAMAPRPAAGYSFALSEGGQPLRWRLPEVVYRVSVLFPEELDWEVARDAVIAGWEVWDAIAFCGLPALRYGGESLASAHTAPTKLTDTGDNVVVFVRTESAWQARGYSPSWIAVTSVTSNTLTGEIIDADIQLDDAYYDFTIGEETDGVDLMSVIAHESGHALGLDHAVDPDATMHAAYVVGSDPFAARTLAPDDLDGICALYAIDEPHLPQEPTCAGGRLPGGLPVAAVWVGLWWLMASRRARFRSPLQR